MCEPASLATFALSAASTVAGYAQQQQAASAQNSYAEQNRINAITAFQNTQAQMDRRILQEQEAAANQRFDTSLQARAVRATNAVAAGEGGIDGNTVEALQRDIFGREQRLNDRVNEQEEWTMGQLSAEKRGQSSQTLDRINSVRQAHAPSFAGAMLKIGAAGIDSYKEYDKLSSSKGFKES